MATPVTKSWSVSAISEGHEPLQLFCGGQPLTQTAVGTVENVCPVEHLLLAVAGCFALSCRAVMAKRQLPRSRFEVLVSGDKAPAPANRLAHIAVAALFDGAISEADAADISAEAKRICTVSNSIVAGPEWSYSARALTSRAAPTPARSVPPA
jgi:uncharacterized OsmC-like protein